jgi:tetratricopeptide (TPR) repeat protein
MLWDKSIEAGKKMVQRPGGDSGASKGIGWGQKEIPWFYAASKLERKSQSQKKKGDIVGAIESVQKALTIRRAALTKRAEGNGDPLRAKLNVARSLVLLGRFSVLSGDTERAQDSFKEAMRLYNSSGLLAKEHACVRELKGELEKLTKTNKL